MPVPPRERLRMLGRFALGCMIIVALAGTAVATAGFESLREITGILGPPIPGPTDPTESGDPQTILLLGSDRRSESAGDPLAGGARSDTMMLVRLDPNADAISVMNIPRDLLVDIPGQGRDKINAAYSEGGPSLTKSTIKRLLSTPEREFKIHHIVDVRFSGFEDIIDSINCVFLDVDRRYFNDNPAFADIDIQPGYQKVCGYDALQYARFREEDSDLVRAARQQDVLRQAKAQVTTSTLISRHDELLRILGANARTDERLRSTDEILNLIKVVAPLAGKPVKQIDFPAIISPDPTDTYLRFERDELDKAVTTFLDGKAKGSGRPQGRPKPDPTPRGASLEDARTAGEDQAVAIAGKVPYPVVFPQSRTPGSMYVDTPRVYPIKRGKDIYTSYRMVLKTTGLGEYYGVQGTRWKDPPILDGPREDRKIGSRTFSVYYDGRRVRQIAWKTDDAVYWLSNTLTASISNKEMLGMARSFRKVG